MPYTPKVLDLFCGAGGLSLGFARAGCKILAGVDFEHWPVETHHRNFPDCQKMLPPTDMRDLDPALLGILPGSIDILIGGPPCQGFSQVGMPKIRSLGQERERDRKNRLYREFLRFIDYFQPRYFVIENVQGLKYFKKQKFLESVLLELMDGPRPNGYDSRVAYDVDCKVLCASDFGVPQMRHRLFIIGRRRDCQELEIRFPEPSGTNAVTLGEAIGDLAEIEAPVLRTRSSKNLINGGIMQKDRELMYRCEPENDYQRLMRDGCGPVVRNHLCRGHNEKDLKIFDKLKQGQKYLDLPARDRRYRDDIFDDKYRRLRTDQPSWTLTAHMQRDCLAYIHPTQKRSLSAREAARIQSFPDSFVFEGPLTKIFRMIGNAVPPLLAEQVARPLVHELRKRARRVEKRRTRFA